MGEYGCRGVGVAVGEFIGGLGDEGVVTGIGWSTWGCSGMDDGCVV